MDNKKHHICLNCLFPNKNGTASCLSVKQKKAVPERRTALALPKGYEEKLDLYNISRSVEFIEPEDFDPIEAKSFSNRWGKWLKRQRPDLQLYDLRHYWGIKSTKSDLSTANAAESMGHSVKIHQDTYLSTFALKDAREVAAKKL